MDTTLMEKTAEDLIAYKLQRAGILVSKPKFDQEGADLLALMEVKDGAKFCRIQCKGRALINSLNSSIKIPKKYVTDSFVVFLFVEDGNEESNHLFAFFSDDIQEWNLNSNDEFVLSLTKSKFQESLKKYAFSNSTIEKIKSIINKANIRTELAVVMPQVFQQSYNRVYENVIYEDSDKKVSVQKNRIGIYETEVIDKSTGVSRVGQQCPGNPDNFDYDPSIDLWKARM